MQPMMFCNRCRGMKVGWNRSYLFHRIFCKDLVSKSLKILVLTLVLSSFVFAFPISAGLSQPIPPVQRFRATTGKAKPVSTPSAGAAVVEHRLARHSVDKKIRGRVAAAIMTSSKKYDVDPMLVASILIVESRGNPFAVSGAGAMGIMQIHLPTWGSLIDKQGINVFKLEDNIDLGVRILKGYVADSGLWDGVARYHGRRETPESHRAAAQYVKKVQRVYGLNADNT